MHMITIFKKWSFVLSSKEAERFFCSVKALWQHPHSPAGLHAYVDVDIKGRLFFPPLHVKG